MSGAVERSLASALWPLIKRLRRDVTATKGADGKAYKTGPSKKHPEAPEQPLTPERLLQHLNGGPVRGCYLIKPGTSVTMVGVLDLDSHKGETPWPEMVRVASELYETLLLLGGEPIAFRSGGGSGIHLYCIWKEPQDAYSVREWLRDVLRSHGLGDGDAGVKGRQVEVFPKKNEVKEGDYGHQVFLPLGGKSVPLAWEELAGELVVMPRESAIGMDWPMSEPVVVRERPVRPAPRPMGEATIAELQVVTEALRAVSEAANASKYLLGHNAWLKLVQALHKVSDGSEEGLAFAHSWSAATVGFDPHESPERVDEIWDSSDADREDGVGLGTIMRVARECGWNEPIDISGFEDISAQDDRPPVAPVEWESVIDGVHYRSTADAMHVTTQQDASTTPGDDDAVLRINPPPLGPAPATPTRLLAKVKRRGIPEAHHLCTDQANAQRLKNEFGSFVFVAAGKWHVWDRRRWHADESDVYRYGCQLSRLIGDEAKAWRAKAAPLLASGDAAEIAEGKKMGLVADALVKWAVKSEMKGCIEAAIGLARKMLTLDVGMLDRDPDLLNVANGTVDLRTGVLRPHDPADYITKLVPVAYRPEAQCVEWLRALEEISGGLPGWVDYLQRWSGYCLTGRTTEQVFVVLWGPGGNGKGVVVGVLTATMGDYAGTAAPGLLVAVKGAERHPTEIASLMGRRMVTAHETSDGVVLREDFVKQATGGDRLTARFMREDFFEFDPTHKLQLLTNHKPQIKGQDLGIWRRVTLLPFVVTFGEAWQVADGSRMKLLDKGLLEKLQAELEGVLAWRVRGAVEWALKGLQPPDVVKAASEDYKREQDRVGQFVAECCEMGLGWSEPLTEGMGGGLYPAYVSWCKDGGVFPLGKSRFLDEVLRVLPVGRTEDRKTRSEGGNRRLVKMILGLRLLPE